MSPTFSAIGIVASDVAASIAFYETLGLEFTGDEGHFEATLPGGSRLMLDTEAVMASFDPEYRPPSEAGRISLAFDCDTPDLVDAVHTAAVGAGYDSLRAPFDAFWGQRYATVLDPDGNAVDLFAAIV
jgi:uncharacterized glyoxalase superfamily protein PhnB